MIHECLVALVGEIGQDDRVEELRVAAVEEEVQLVTGILRVLGELRLGVEFRPLDQEPEFGEGGVGAQRVEVVEDLGEVFIGFDFRGAHVCNVERLSFGEHRCLLLLGEVGVCGKAVGEPEVADNSAALRQRELAEGGVLRVDGEHLEELAVAEVGGVDTHHAVFVGDEVEDSRRAAG